MLPKTFECPLCPDRDPDPECGVCAGSGQWTLRRCPYVYTNGGDRKVVSCASMVELGVLPAPGGWQDQTAWFQQAASLVLHDKRAYEEDRIKHPRRLKGR